MMKRLTVCLGKEDLVAIPPEARAFHMGWLFNAQGIGFGEMRQQKDDGMVEGAQRTWTYFIGK